MSTLNDLKYLVISDIHLGHAKNTTQDIVKNLRTYFEDFNDRGFFTELDIIFIAGDLFDRLLDLSNSDVSIIQVWVFDLMRFCARHNIQLRMLLGTPSHDWKQYSIIESVLRISMLDLDFKYINDITIERNPLGINILYVPDVIRPSADKVLEDVQQLMSDNHLDQVDIAIMHGMFEYQLGNIPKCINTHNSAIYQNLVRYLVHIGHIHTFSTCGRIIAQGSFDRIAHGEEEPKGGVYVEIKQGEVIHRFIENKDAKTYKTITFKSKDLEKCIPQLEKALAKLRIGSFVRLKADKDHPLLASLQQVKSDYPDFHFTKLTETEEETPRPAYELVEITYTPIVITQDNIVGSLMSAIQQRHLLPEAKLSELNQLLESLV